MTSWTVWGDLGRDASPGWSPVAQPGHMAEELQPPSPDDSGDCDRAARPRVDLVIGDVMEIPDAEDVTEADPVGCVNVFGHP